MDTFSPEDAGHVVGMILQENKGSLLTEALIIGIQQSVIHYSLRIQESAKKSLELVPSKEAA